MLIECGRALRHAGVALSAIDIKWVDSEDRQEGADKYGGGQWNFGRWFGSRECKESYWLFSMPGKRCAIFWVVWVCSVQSLVRS